MELIICSWKINLICSRIYTLSFTTFCMNRFGQNSLYWVLNNLQIKWKQNIRLRALLGCQISEKNSVYVSNKRLDFFLTPVVYITLLFYKKFFKKCFYCKNKSCSSFLKKHTINLFEEMLRSKNRRQYTIFKNRILIFFSKYILDTFLFKVNR